MVQIRSSGLTDVGRKRSDNEDALLVDDARGLYVVADGMGGHRAGEVASRMVVERFSGSLPQVVPGFFDEALSEAAARVVACVREANYAVYERSCRDQECHGMGSTVAVLLCTGDTAIAVNVGDSPIYLVRNNAAERVSVLHTVGAERVARDPGALAAVPERVRHMLSRAVGVDGEVEPDVCEIPCTPGDRFILCSDGLSDLVEPREMADIALGEEPEAACRRLVGLANDRGGHDNITVIVLQVPGDGQSTGLLGRVRSWFG